MLVGEQHADLQFPLRLCCAARDAERRGPPPKGHQVGGAHCCPASDRAVNCGRRPRRAAQRTFQKFDALCCCRCGWLARSRGFGGLGPRGGGRYSRSCAPDPGNRWSDAQDLLVGPGASGVARSSSAGQRKGRHARYRLTFGGVTRPSTRDLHNSLGAQLKRKTRIRVSFLGRPVGRQILAASAGPAVHERCAASSTPSMKVNIASASSSGASMAT
jgi:hypothetical protein